MSQDMSLETAMRNAIEPMRLMQRVADQTMDLIPGADGVLIGLADSQGVSYVWGAGPVADFVGTRVNLDDSLTGLAIRTGRVARSDDTENDPRVDKAACRRLSAASNVCVPLSRGWETLGVLAAKSSQVNAFSHEDVALLSRLADFVSVAIGLTRDLARVSTQLLDLSQPGRGSARSCPSAEAASRFVMAVLNPSPVPLIGASPE